jgi:hypothetical protein
MLRNVLSSVAGRDVSEEYADAVEKLLDTELRTPVRYSFSKDRYGQFTARAAVISYTSPDTGEERWAHYYDDSAVREVEEADSRTEAEERYEENVRALADCAMEGTCWWQETDVDGVPVEATGGSDDEDL